MANYQSEGGATWTDSLVFYSTLGRLSHNDVLRLPTLGASWVSARDLNEDGYPELVFSNANVTNQRSIFSYIYWNEEGRFRFGNHSQLPTAGSVANTVGDLNNDGAPDVVFFNDEGGFRDGASQTDLYWGDGTRSFAARPAVSFPTHQIFGIGQADLDDDGYVDLILTRENFIQGVAHEQSGITVHWGSDRGFQRTSEITSESSYGGVRIADINKDGFLDMLTGGTTFDPEYPETNGIPIHWGSADGFRRENRSIIPSRKEKTRGPLLADLDKDGWLDVAAQEENGTFSIWYGSAEGFDTGRHRTFELGRPDQLMYIQAADLNRDGWLDLLLPQRGPADGTETSSFIYYGGAEGFSNDRRATVASYVAYQNTIADLDRDGWLDLVLMAYGGEVSGNRPSLIYWGNQDGFSTRPRTELLSYGSSGSVALDFDRDGWLDLFFANHRRSGSTLVAEPHRHSTDSMLFWGGPNGYSDDRRFDIPSRGPSGLNLRDPGNSYDRGFYEDYISSGHHLPDREKPSSIDWEAESPFGTGVQFQIRTATSEAGLATSPWMGPDGAYTWWTEPGPIDNPLEGGWIQYRARLLSPNAGPSPVLSRVTLHFE
ncbi:MAG: VCBS repeat-containing protein [Opitutaceae bacterium]